MGGPARRPKAKETTARIRNTTNRIQAISEDTAATPKRPSAPATKATIRKSKAICNMSFSFSFRICNRSKCHSSNYFPITRWRSFLLFKPPADEQGDDPLLLICGQFTGKQILRQQFNKGYTGCGRWACRFGL